MNLIYEAKLSIRSVGCDISCSALCIIELSLALLPSRCATDLSLCWASAIWDPCNSEGAASYVVASRCTRGLLKLSARFLLSGLCEGYTDQVKTEGKEIDLNYLYSSRLAVDLYLVIQVGAVYLWSSFLCSRIVPFCTRQMDSHSCTGRSCFHTDSLGRFLEAGRKARNFPFPLHKNKEQVFEMCVWAHRDGGLQAKLKVKAITETVSPGSDLL